jgi:PAS domain-containing protein
VDNEAEFGGLYAIEIDAAGFGEPRVIFEADEPVYDLQRDDPNLIVVFPQRVLIGPDVDQLALAARFEGRGLRRLLVRPGTPRHVLVGAAGYIAWGDLAQGESSVSETSFQELFDVQFTDALWVYDLDGRVVVANSRGELAVTRDFVEFELTAFWAPWMPDDCGPIARLEDCGQGDLGIITRPYRSGDRLLAHFDRCTEVGVGPNARCLAPVSFSDEVARAESIVISGAAEDGADGFLILGNDGLLLEAR